MTLPGFVLVGGASRRMGTDKALLRLGGARLGDRVLAVLVKSGLKPVFWVGRDDTWTPARATLVLDSATTDRHPLHGVAAALAHPDSQRAGAAVVVPCDLPDLNPRHIEALLAAGPPSVACVDGVVQPLLACLPASWCERATELAFAGASARRLVHQASQVSLGASAAADLDTPDQLARWRQRHNASQ